MEGVGRAGRAEDLIIAPKIAQAVFAAAMDFYTWRLGEKVYEEGSEGAMATASDSSVRGWLICTDIVSFVASAHDLQPMAVLYIYENVCQLF